MTRALFPLLPIIVLCACAEQSAPPQSPVGPATPAGATQPSPMESQSATAPASQDATAATAPAATERLDLSEAVALARKRYPDFPPIEVEIEMEDDRELLEVEFLTESGIREIYLHPRSGEVVKEADEELSKEEAATLPTLREALAADAEITLEKMIARAESTYDKAAIREVELEIHDGDTLVMEVSVMEGDSIVEWVHDPKTGKVLGQEDEAEEHAER